MQTTWWARPHATRSVTRSRRRSARWRSSAAGRAGGRRAPAPGRAWPPSWPGGPPSACARRRRRATRHIARTIPPRAARSARGAIRRAIRTACAATRRSRANVSSAAPGEDSTCTSKPRRLASSTWPATKGSVMATVVACSSRGVMPPPRPLAADPGPGTGRQPPGPEPPSPDLGQDEARRRGLGRRERAVAPPDEAALYPEARAHQVGHRLEARPHHQPPRALRPDSRRAIASQDVAHGWLGPEVVRQVARGRLAVEERGRGMRANVVEAHVRTHVPGPRPARSAGRTGCRGTTPSGR